MTATTWTDVAARLARSQELRPVEVIGSTARITGSVDLGSFARLSDFVMALPGYLRLEGAVVLNRRGMPTSDHERELRLHPDQVMIIGEAGPGPILRPAPSADEYVDKQHQQVTLLTGSHIVHGTISLYPGATASAYLEAADPPFIPVQSAAVRWLADRRLRRSFGFALVNRRHVMGAAVGDQPLGADLGLTWASGWR